MHPPKRNPLLDTLLRYWPSFNLISDQQLVDLEAALMEESQLSLNYIVLVLGAAGIATTGLIANSPAVIIGAMIVAPLMLPIRGVTLGALTGNLTLVKRGIQAVVIGSLLGVGIAYLFTLLIAVPSLGSEILARTRPNTLDLIVALIAGVIGAFAKARPKLADSLAGVAIAVALMPPLCVVGIGLAKGDAWVSSGALMLYITNLVGIGLACSITFFVMGYSPHRRHQWLSRGAINFFVLLLFVVALMVVPLSFSRMAFIQQDYFKAVVTSILVDETELFRNATLLNSHFNWRTDPPTASLLVLSETPFTVKQVGLLEEYIEDRTGEPVTLTVQFLRVYAPLEPK